MGMIPKGAIATQNAISATSCKTNSRTKLSIANLILIIGALTAVLLISLPHALPHTMAYINTLRYPACGHIVLVSTQRHGSTWFISNAEGCTSINGSFGLLNPTVEIWNHWKVRNITLEGAIDLVRFNTSVKILPKALYNEQEKVKGFFESMRAINVPVFVLRRQLERSFASLQAAMKSKVWNSDHGGEVVERDFEGGRKFLAYKNRTETYFRDVKRLMSDVGIVWDEIEYETVLSQRLILGENSNCYVRNCNF